jgi:hypothetical protein
MQNRSLVTELQDKEEYRWSKYRGFRGSEFGSQSSQFGLWVKGVDARNFCIYAFPAYRSIAQ